jgi:hypothetical protein
MLISFAHGILLMALKEYCKKFTKCNDENGNFQEFFRASSSDHGFDVIRVLWSYLLSHRIWAECEREPTATASSG